MFKTPTEFWGFGQVLENPKLGFLDIDNGKIKFKNFEIIF